MIPIILLNNVRRFASSFASVTNFFAQGSSRLSDSMATPQRGPPRKTVDALVALDRVRAEMLAGNVEVSAVTRPRGAIKADAASAHVIAFTIRRTSDRRRVATNAALHALLRSGRVAARRRLLKISPGLFWRSAVGSGSNV